MIVTRCYKFRLEPTTEQELEFFLFAGCRRFVWNWALERKKTVYQETGKGIYYKALAAELVQLKKQPGMAFLRECHSQVLQQTLMDLDKAFVSFFEKRAKFPKFKSRKNTPHSFRIPQYVSVVDGKVSVPKIGLINVRLHREMEGEIKSATIKQEPSGHWNITKDAPLAHTPNPLLPRKGFRQPSRTAGCACHLRCSCRYRCRP